MPRHAKKSPREKNVTTSYLNGGLDDDRLDNHQRFTDKSKRLDQNRMDKTTAMRAAAAQIDADALPQGEVIQVHSLFSEVESEGVVHLCTMRKTLAKMSDTYIVVGDRVRFRKTDVTHESGKPEGVIERVEPRDTVLTRADSFKAIVQHPIVANAQQMLIVASLALPGVKWGLIDRMIVAARGGGLTPILCLNKIDLATENPEAYEFAKAAIEQYKTIEVDTIEASVVEGKGLKELSDRLANKVTVLAGHSGVGKSSLVGAIQRGLDIRIGAVSGFNQKGRHTTTSARRYVLDTGGAVIDTPGVKLFGLWNVTPDNLIAYFPDVEAGTAPTWRSESYERILLSLKDR